MKEKHDSFHFQCVRAYHSLPLELKMCVFTYGKNLDGETH